MSDLKSTLQKISSLRNDGKTIGFTCSCFDILHAGHYLMLKDSRNQCDFLVVGLQTDPTKDLEYRMKSEGKNKNMPIQDYEERLIQIEGCRYVDWVVKYEGEDELYEIISAINPDVRVLGSDWEGKEYTGHDLPPKIHWHRRDHDYSTSNLRKRVFEAEKRKN
jgi:glycerol-3-phosphate cytidylyltransferase